MGKRHDGMDQLKTSVVASIKSMRRESRKNTMVLRAETSLKLRCNNTMGDTTTQNKMRLEPYAN